MSDGRGTNCGLTEGYCIYIALATLPRVRMDGLLRTECLFLYVFELSLLNSNRAFGNTFILITEFFF